LADLTSSAQEETPSYSNQLRPLVLELSLLVRAVPSVSTLKMGWSEWLNPEMPAQGFSLLNVYDHWLTNYPKL